MFEDWADLPVEWGGVGGVMESVNGPFPSEAYTDGYGVFLYRAEAYLVGLAAAHAADVHKQPAT